MAIKHGTANISTISIYASGGISAAGPAHIYHNDTWVFDERCIRFYSSSSFTIKLANSNGGASWNGTIQTTKSTALIDVSTWLDYTADTELTAALVNYGDGLSRYEISFRGVGNTRLATGTGVANCSTFTITGTDVYCDGDLLYLLDYSTNVGSNAQAYTYARLFQNCAALKSLPKMSLATLPSYCYYYTYMGCTGLIEVPTSKLIYTGFTSGSSYNCGYMFYGCTGIKSVSMPSTLTSFTERCYYYMFYNNTALLNAPSIMPNNTSVILGTYCFGYMFYYCTSLVNATFTNVLTFGTQGTLGSGSTLGTYCFASMFQNCSALTYARKTITTSYDIVKLAPTSLNSNCYRRMYYNCSSLKFATGSSITGDGRYSHAYRIPTSGTAGGTTTNATYQMLTGTGGTFTGTPTLGTTYYGFIPD